MSPERCSSELKTLFTPVLRRATSVPARGKRHYCWIKLLGVVVWRVSLDQDKDKRESSSDDSENQNNAQGAEASKSGLDVDGLDKKPGGENSEQPSSAKSDKATAIPTSKGGKKEKILKLGVGALFLGAAISMAYWVNWRTSKYPATESGSIDAEVVHAATTVGGRLLDLPIEVNEHVVAGQLLYKIDPTPYQIGVEQAEAHLAFSKAALEQTQREINVQNSTVSQARAAEVGALERRNLAQRTVDRLRPLAGKNYISTQEYDTALTSLAQAEADLARSRSASSGAKSAVTDLHMAESNVKAAEAALAQAKYQLSQTELYASVSGYITSLEIKQGEVLAPGQALFTLVSDEKWYAQANIREIELANIKEGECVTVYSMISRNIPMRGTVVSIGHGVSVSNTHTVPFTVPYLEQTMDWVHIAQRFPVRILLPNDHPELLRMGATATVEIGRGSACRGKPDKAHNIENIKQAQESAQVEEK
ncbi:multidrug resistance transporter [Lasius niger]|uniref:Multidrug resistance transporter n=1 Tax=Lasius niger TaxID=67767 RepID=A0A0J7KQ69_LASNI|nr:multidrug resistance transporter [Lasius niger]